MTIQVSEKEVLKSKSQMEANRTCYKKIPREKQQFVQKLSLKVY